MITNIFDLPSLYWVGGETKTVTFKLHTSNRQPFDATGATVTFSFVYSMNRKGQPLLSRKMTIISDSNGMNSIASVTVNPEDTSHLGGKFIYQITISDSYGDNDIHQGFLTISNNIDKNVAL